MLTFTCLPISFEKDSNSHQGDKESAAQALNACVTALPSSSVDCWFPHYYACGVCGHFVDRGNSTVTLTAVAKVWSV